MPIWDFWKKDDEGARSSLNKQQTSSQDTSPKVNNEFILSGDSLVKLNRTSLRMLWITFSFAVVTTAAVVTYYLTITHTIDKNYQYFNNKIEILQQGDINITNDIKRIETKFDKNIDELKEEIKVLDNRIFDMNSKKRKK